MKYLSEYRDVTLCKSLIRKIRATVTRQWNIMEVCGGQTHSLVKNGILQMLPKEVNMIHGPGCPVCVTPMALIDRAIELALRPNVILCSFGDMLRVPGSAKSLLQAKAEGADVRMVYSPLDAVALAQKQPDKEVIFFAVGFETTAPANALSVIQANELGLANYALLTSHVLVPPAMEAILSDPDNHVDGFLAAGHVCTIMGQNEYLPIAKKYRVPIAITGFEPVDLLKGIESVVNQLETGEARVDNQYARVVLEDGNYLAQQTISRVFEIQEREWRGIGTIPASGYELRDDFRRFDARYKFDISEKPPLSENGSACMAGAVLKGIIKPFECPHFGKTCNPEKPLGAPMVSSEGACAAYYHYYGQDVPEEQNVGV